MDELPPERAFLELSIRDRTNLNSFEVFHKFIDDEVIETIINSLGLEAFSLGRRTDSSNDHRVLIGPRLVWQSIAIQVWLTGRQVRATENEPNSNFLKSRIEYSSQFFRDQCGEAPYSRNAMERAIAQLLITDEISGLISRKFCSIIDSLGQYVAGDEKLFKFTGNSTNVRLVVSKPDRVGLWFYELCGELQSGLPFLLHVFLHHNQEGTITVDSVVKRWIDVMKTVGKTRVPDNELPNPKCILAADSYYLTNSVKTLMEKSANQQIKFTFSVNKDRMKPEVRMVHPANREDKPGEFAGITNETTSETFVYHYDTQKGVGIKYNYARGFLRVTEKQKVKEKNAAKVVPVYEYYKQLFELCDKFNRNLHDCTFPHKRGGRGRVGEFGRQNDFMLAVILQNTRNVYATLKKLNPSLTNFSLFCDELSIQIFAHSLSL